MSRKSSVSSSNSNTDSRKWRTDFKEIDSPRSLPTYYGDEELQQHHTPPLSSSLGEDNPLKELQPLGRGTGSAGSVRSAGSRESFSHPLGRFQEDLSDEDCEIGVDVSTLPLDIDNPSVHKLLIDKDDDVPSKETVEQSLNPANPEVVIQNSPDLLTDKSNDESSSTVQDQPKNILISSSGSELFEAGSEVSPISSDLSLGKIENAEVEADDLMDDSLDLFQDVRKKEPRPAPPPRPPKPKVQDTEMENHPLMQIIDPDPDLNFDENFSNFKEAKPDPEPPKSGLRSKLSKSLRRTSKSPRPEEIEKPSPTPPENKTETTSQETSSISTGDTISITSSDTTPSRKQKFKAMRSQLAAKAYSKYNQYYDYYYNKNKQGKEEEQTAERTRTSSENSEGSFCEITAEELEVIPREGAGEDSDAEQSATEFIEEEEEQVVTANVTPNNEPATSSVQSPTSSTSLQPDPSSLPTTSPTQTSSLSRLINYQFGISYQKHLILSSVICIVSIVLYIVIYHCNSFLQGVFLGGFIPTLLGVLFLVITRVPPEDDVVSGAKTVLQVERLRKLGASASIKDFFQYTEAHNFGELRTKSMPYRYFKLKGSIIQASELNATKEEVPDPLKLTPAEIKTYGLKPIFKADISGWLVSVEAPPGVKITPSNMWRKRYPIWVRKRSWRTEVDEYDSEYTVNSFYLISPYSRYKELWYEALRRAVNSDEVEDTSNLETEDYKDFMERLFDVIPSVEKDKNSKVGAENSSQNAATNEIEAPSPETKASDMQHSAWVNALFGRFVWNILHDKKWENRIHERIVKKLSSVNTRHISSVELKSFDLGNSVPLITNTYLPKIDHQGVWSEMDLEWSGEVSLTLAARVNSKSQSQNDNSKTFEPMKLENERGGEQATSSGKLAKLYKLIEKIEIGVSAKVTRVAGRLCVNIPPPPTDCIWYGFTEPPELKIHLTPILGRWISLDYRPITNALEKQLHTVFNDTFVLPAMENIVMPGMSRNLLMKPTTETNIPSTIDVTQIQDPTPTDNELLDVATSSNSRSGSMRNSPVV